MSLHKPYFILEKVEDTFRIRHNCNGGVGFNCTEDVSEETARYIKYAMFEGERNKARELCKCLGIPESNS